MELANTQMQKKYFICSQHNKTIEFIYLKNDNNSKVACRKCLLENKLEHEYIIEIEQLIQSQDSTFFKQLPLGLSQQLYQDLISTQIQDDLCQQLIDSITLIFEICTNQIVEEMNNHKNNLIYHINKMDAERWNTIETYNNSFNKQELIDQILQSQNDLSSLDNYLNKFIQTKSNSSFQTNEIIQASLNQFRNLTYQLDIELIENSMLNIIQMIQSFTILQDPIQNYQKNEITIPNEYLIQKQLFTRSISKLNSIPNLMYYQNIKLELENQKLKYGDIDKLNNHLKQFKYLNQLYLNLGNNQISNYEIQNLNKSFGCFSQLTEARLYLHDNKIGKQGLQYLTDALKSYKNLKILDLGLNNNNIINEDLVFVVDTIASQKYLTELYLGLNSTKPGKNIVKSLSQAINSLTLLSYLRLSLNDNELHEDDILSICSTIQTLSTNLTVLKLWLKQNYTKEPSEHSLKEYISFCLNLTELDLHINTVPVEGNIKKRQKLFEEDVKSACKKLTKTNICLYTQVIDFSPYVIQDS